MHRLQEDEGHRQPRSEAHQHQSYKERQNLVDADVDAALHSADERVLSEKIENHVAAVALYFMYYNFVRVHQTLRVTPAMDAGVTGKLWDVADIVALLDRKIETDPLPPGNEG